MEEKETVTLGNLCGGAIEEVFQREFAEVLQNISDVNTDPEAKRKITLEFTLEPFEDRSGAQVTFACKSKTVAVNAVKGTIFLQRKGTNIVGVPHDPRQSRLTFDGKSAAAGEAKKEIN
jgi:hypothetical protein